MLICKERIDQKRWKGHKISRGWSQIKCSFLYSNTIHKGNTWWEISVTTLMAQYMCWPLSSSCRKRYETKIDTKMSVSPLERIDQEKCHKHTCFQWWLHYVSKYVFFLYITYSNTYFLYMFIYMLKGSITDGHGFEPQRFTGLQSLAQRNCPRSSPSLTPSLSTPPPPSTEGRWWLLRRWGWWRWSADQAGEGRTSN